MYVIKILIKFLKAFSTEVRYSNNEYVGVCRVHDQINRSLGL